MAYNPPLHSLISSTGSLGQANRSSTSLLNPQLTLLADPPLQHKVDLQLVHFVTHEVRPSFLPPLQRRVLLRLTAFPFDDSSSVSSSNPLRQHVYGERSSNDRYRMT